MKACKEKRIETPATSTEKNGPVVQAKLTAGAPGTLHEKEADTIANKVMRMPGESFVQRKCAHCEEEDKQLQRKTLPGGAIPTLQASGGNAGTVSDSLSARISSAQGSGSNMDKNTGSFMSSRFGADFSNVKIHTGNEATQMNRSLNAKAFTVGSDIYFNEGQYQPGSDSGKQLLAHELVHTLQQGKGNVQRQVQRWTISGNTATSDSEDDTLGGLAIKAGGHFNDWKCIKPLSMKTATMSKPPAKFNDHYELYVQNGDTFDVSNITATTGGSMSVYLFDDSTEKMHGDLAKLFYPGSVSSLGVDSDLDSNSSSGSSPISSLVIMGHAGGGSMWGNASTFIPKGLDPEDPAPSHTLASVGLFPRRCWLTRNATVRSVGCDSETFGKDFAAAYLRDGANIVTTTKSIRPKCSAPNYVASTDTCTLFDGLDFAASPSRTARMLEGPFWSVGAFHGGTYWKTIKGKL